MKEKDINSLDHTRWRCQYHVVFAPKYRRMAIYGEIKVDIGKILRQLCKQKGIEIIEAELCQDHVHMLYIPNLVSTDTNYEIGYWGRKHKEYIKQYKPAFYTTLLTQCKLNSYLHDVDVRATEMYDRLVKQLKEQQGITEQLKADDIMAWVQAMNNITNQAREIVNNEVIYTV